MERFSMGRKGRGRRGTRKLESLMVGHSVTSQKLVELVAVPSSVWTFLRKRSRATRRSLGCWRRTARARTSRRPFCRYSASRHQKAAGIQASQVTKNKGKVLAHTRQKNSLSLLFSAA